MLVTSSEQKECHKQITGLRPAGADKRPRLQAHGTTEANRKSPNKPALLAARIATK